MSILGARLGVDIGGTFTDVVLEQDGERFSTKVLTTYAAPEDAIIEGMHRVCEKAGIAASAIGQIIHGTTLATNALIERRGAKTALITTEGFRDVIEMRTESRFEQYDLNLTLPAPLLPRNRRYTVKERMDARGKVLVPLDRAAVEALVDELREAGYESVAVGLLHSYVNDAHERLIQEVLAERLPGPHAVTDEDLFEYGCANAKTDHHPVGTCKMGTGADAVVDLQLKVRGLEGLRVCDSSVMPRVPSCNTNAPTIMVGEKGSDMIRGLDPLPPAVFAWERNDTRPRFRADPR